MSVTPLPQPRSSTAKQALAKARWQLIQCVYLTLTLSNGESALLSPHIWDESLNSLSHMAVVDAQLEVLRREFGVLGSAEEVSDIEQLADLNVEGGIKTVSHTLCFILHKYAAKDMV